MFSQRFLTHLNIFFLVINVLFVVFMPKVSIITYFAIALHAVLTIYHSGKIEEDEKNEG